MNTLIIMLNRFYIYHLEILSLLHFIDFQPEIVSISEYQLVHPNQPLQIECVATGSPRPTLLWLHDGVSVVSIHRNN